MAGPVPAIQNIKPVCAALDHRHKGGDGERSVLPLQLNQNRNEGKRSWQGLDEQNFAADRCCAVNARHDHTGEAEDQGWSVANIKGKDDARCQKAIVKPLIGGKSFGFAGEFCRCAKGSAGARRFPAEHF